MKCAACQTGKSVGDYAIKSCRQLASCNNCRDKAKIQRHVKNTEPSVKNTEAPIKNIEVPIKNTEVPIKNTEATTKNTEVPAKNTESKDKLIERKLCLNREFLHRAFFPTHKYNFHDALVDIRDRFSPSLDKSISHCNTDYFHSSFY